MISKTKGATPPGVFSACADGSNFLNFFCDFGARSFVRPSPH